MFEMTVYCSCRYKGQQNHVCETCRHSFCSKSNLVRHSKRHASPNCVSGMWQAFFRRPWTSLPHGGRPYGYPLPLRSHGLYEVLQQRHALKLHMKEHSGTMTFVCDMCGRGFNQCAHFDGHMNAHRGEKKFKCSFCNAGFLLASDHQKHDVGCGKKPQFHCSICKKFFKSKRHLKEHKGP